ncbi:MAG: hypothetical protein ACRCT1_07690 [Microcoleaceae cyanobacterium]
MDKNLPICRISGNLTLLEVPIGERRKHPPLEQTINCVKSGNFINRYYIKATFDFWIISFLGSLDFTWQDYYPSVFPSLKIYRPEIFENWLDEIPLDIPETRQVRFLFLWVIPRMTIEDSFWEHFRWIQSAYFEDPLPF